MSGPDTDRDPLEALAAEFAERQRRGERPSVSDYAAKYPELADAIRELFPTIAAVERLKAHKEQSGSGRASLGGVRLERLGDFRIIREIGRGGMGIVYEAEQESLGRRVAIKVLPRQSLLDPKHLKRFEREARTAARLHHTNIVEVFGVGEQEGFNYYVMQIIHGVGLDQIIARLRRLEQTCPTSANTEEIDRIIQRVFGAHDRLPMKQDIPFSFDADYWQAVAQIGRQAADALEYAHSEGTLHRDIKPANLLVDVHGRVWITDFGLAKALQSEDVTVTGDLTGTLRYMAPEQFGGQSDVKSDIYSLGLTLYELLALRPAYEDADRASIMRHITDGTVERPRRLNPHIPHDLETIVLKAMARDPDQRYPSAGAMAADLQCFIEDRPIQARRVGSIERLWRWCRRNRAVASLSAAALLLTALVAVIATVGYVRTRNALEGEARQREKAETNAALAIEALDQIFKRFSPNPIAVVPGLSVDGAEGMTIEVPTPPVLSKEAAALLEGMLAFYDRLANQVANEAALRQRTAEANVRVGDIRQRLGQYDEAVAAYCRAADIYQKLGKSSPEGAKFSVEIARIHNELGQLFRSTRQSDKARQSHLAALAVLQSASPESSATPEIRYELARTYYFLGIKDRPPPGSRPRGRGHGPRGPGRPEGGHAEEGLPFRPPDTDEGATPFGRRSEEGYLDKAIAMLSELAEQHPSNPSYRHLLALCYRDRFPQGDPRDRDSAVESLDRATEILEHLVRDFPDVPDYRYDLSETYAMPDPRDPLPPGYTYERIEQRFRKALSISEELVAENPYIPSYVASQAQVHHKLGDVLRRMHRFDEAMPCLRKAVALQLSLANQFPDVPSYSVWLGAFRNSLADLLMRQGEVQEARSMLEDAIAMLTGLLEKYPDMWFVHGMLARNYTDLASLLRQNGEQKLASGAERQAEEHRGKMPGEPPGPGAEPRRRKE